MRLKTGIVGMPNVGKSTLFNAVTEAQGAMCANYPFATIEPNIGVVEVPDGRLKVLSEINKSVKTVPSTLDFYDIAGLVKVCDGRESEEDIHGHVDTFFSRRFSFFFLVLRYCRLIGRAAARNISFACWVMSGGG